MPTAPVTAPAATPIGPPMRQPPTATAKHRRRLDRERHRPHRLERPQQAAGCGGDPGGEPEVEHLHGHRQRRHGEGQGGKGEADEIVDIGR